MFQTLSRDLFVITALFEMIWVGDFFGLQSFDVRILLFRVLFLEEVFHFNGDTCFRSVHMPFSAWVAFTQIVLALSFFFVDQAVVQ